MLLLFEADIFQGGIVLKMNEKRAISMFTKAAFIDYPGSGLCERAKNL
jgi:hypothetical protein